MSPTAASPRCDLRPRSSARSASCAAATSRWPRRSPPFSTRSRISARRSPGGGRLLAMSPGLGRRAFVAGAASALVAARATAQTAPATAGPVDPKLIEDLVASNRILADQGVVDGYGHVSMRHPANPQRYLMSRSIAPELVTAADVMEYDLDSVPVDARGRVSYLERFIHGEIYKARPDVKAVAHSHSPSVIPFGATGVALKPLYHMSAFLWAGVPVFDIRVASGETTDMLVRSPALGRALAQTLGTRPVALMRGHGNVIVGVSLPQVVFRSVYTEMNARLQAQAMALGGNNVTYLSPEEVSKVDNTVGGTILRPWELWKRKVRRSP